MGIDYHIHAFVKQDSYSTEMDYPSTTQALFALVVMIIVLMFILVYCCSGAFPCNNNTNNNNNNNTEEQEQPIIGNQQEPEDRRRRPTSRTPSSAQDRYHPSTGMGETLFRDLSHSNSNHQRTVVVVPVNGMFYYRENQQSDRSQMSSSMEKPPAYSELFNPPPPYSIQAVFPSPTDDCLRPPPYEESFRDWKLTMNNDNRFDNLLNEDRQPQNESLTRTINEFINETPRPQIATNNTNPNIDNRLNSQDRCAAFPHANVVSSHTQINMENSCDYRTNSQTLYASSRHSERRLDSDIESIDSTFSHNRRSGSSINGSASSSVIQDQNKALVVRSENNEHVPPSMSAPDTDVYSLMREVTIAEHSRRETDASDTTRLSSESLH